MKRRIAVLLVWTLPSVLFLAITCVTFRAYRIPPPDRLDGPARFAMIEALRAALDGKPEDPALLQQLTHTVRGPIVATVWSSGRSLATVNDESTDLAAATRALAAKLQAHPKLAPLDAALRAKARIQVDIVTGTGPLGGDHWLFDRLAVPGIADMLAINPGVEGIGVTINGVTTVVLPHELVGAKLLAAKKPSAALADFAIGVDLNKIRTMVATRANQKTGVAAKDLFRFRTDTFVELPVQLRRAAGAPYTAAADPLPLYRGVPPVPKINAAVLRAAALDGGRYLIGHLAPNGRYIYEHDVGSGLQTDPKGPSYSMPRHAGTTYFLAELYRITKEEWLREPIERAFAHLAELMGNKKCTSTLPDGTPIDCVMDRNDRIATLGSTALSVVALAEYQRATGDKRYLPTATKLASFILWMQRDDGSFRHRYDPASRKADDTAQDLYYSGEAALALARMHVITGEAKYAQGAERAVDWLVDWYDFFMSGFFYGEEHWTCISAEATWPAAKNPKYRDFCHGYGAFLRQQQPEAGEHPDEDDLAGSYNFTPFLMPNNTPAGSRTEAMISAYLLGRHHGTPDGAVREQVRGALQYVLGQQLRPDTDFNVVGPGYGGIPGSPIDRNVRIDFVQHVCS
ncbi:MAG: hypothetical protein H0V17_22855, partial [Deltaproteobacteria bacterium]|nr:hypothetical protein [Deltaproteobacteria bacterium]